VPTALAHTDKNERENSLSTVVKHLAGSWNSNFWLSDYVS
jgi:hypothetical protein